jgi:hypothetical protein
MFIVVREASKPGLRLVFRWRKARKGAGETKLLIGSKASLRENL